MSVRPDNRLTDEPMHPVSCDACGADLRVRKSSWNQTSVQWDEEAVRTCTAWNPGCSVVGQVPVCEELRASIARAVVDGELPVVDPTP